MVLHPFQKRAREEAKKLAATQKALEPAKGITPVTLNEDELKEVAAMSKKNPSRRERFEQAMGWVSDAVGVIEELKGELEEWRSNLPENLQNGSKAEELDEAIQTLESIYDNLESASNEDVTFPGAFGK